MNATLFMMYGSYLTRKQRNGEQTIVFPLLISVCHYIVFLTKYVIDDITIVLSVFVIAVILVISFIIYSFSIVHVILKIAKTAEI